jgi:imidazolonepropionase-like amidohydrolase
MPRARHQSNVCETGFASQPTLIRGGTVMTAAGQVIPNGQVLIVDGRIAAVGRR